MTAGRRSLLVLVPLLVAGAAWAQDPKPRPDPRPRVPLDTARPRLPGDTARPRTSADTAAVPGPGPAGTTPAASADPGGRYRVTLRGVTVHRQTYDNPLQTDGKGDEVYFATWIASIDTGSAGLAEHRILRSREYGDVKDYGHRVRAGSASLAGGIRTGDRLPSTAVQKGGADTAQRAFPMLLWEGTLQQGRSAVVLAPTVWERDGNPELFGLWMISRGAALERLLRPRMLLAIVQNRTYLPQEFGSPGFLVRTNTVADARDRPIGLDRGRPVNDAAFVEASAKPVGSTADGAPGNVFAMGGSVTKAIGRLIEEVLRLASRIAEPLLELLWPQYELLMERARSTGQWLSGNLAAKSSLPDLKLPMPDEAAALAKARLAATVDTLSAGQTKPVRVPVVPQLVPTHKAAVRDFRGSEFYFFEQLIVLTPAAIAELHKYPATATRPRGSLDVTYLDQLQLAGRYTLHLHVERLP